ncbi:MAG: GDSL-type esterase/lipase family protein [Deltaproteobacteria bacterium]|jgi:lysophospholipase L1-like esterase|nr:GDSL-type esterase/lipase family protein [Deltaproteobacteria bacterium]
MAKRLASVAVALMAALSFCLLLSFGPLWADGPRNIVMLGDSLTAGGDWAPLDPGGEVLNQGVPGDGFNQILRRLGATVEARPGIVFLQVGINDLGAGRDMEAIVSGHRAIWQELRSAIPGLRLVVCSLIPVSERAYGERSRISNRRILETNRLLAEAASRAGLEFVDLFGPLFEEGQGLPRDLTFDGLHLTKKGQGIWLGELASFLAASR